MEKYIKDSVRESIAVKELLLQNVGAVEDAARLLIGAVDSGKRIFICGNGGSAADSQHMAAELSGRFEMERRGLPCIALTVDSSALTALSNDYGFDRVFSRQLEALAGEGDVLIGISTSGNSPNVAEAAAKAGEMGLKIIALTGQSGGALEKAAHVCIRIPSARTCRVQESHILIIHILCGILERELFGRESRESR